jgi:hypothetical protein
MAALLAITSVSLNMCLVEIKIGRFSLYLHLGKLGRENSRKKYLARERLSLSVKSCVFQAEAHGRIPRAAARNPTCGVAHVFVATL